MAFLNFPWQTDGLNYNTSASHFVNAKNSVNSVLNLKNCEDRCDDTKKAAFLSFGKNM